MAEQHNQIATQPISPFRRFQSDNALVAGSTSFGHMPSNKATYAIITQQSSVDNNKAVSAKMSDFEAPSRFVTQVSFKENKEGTNN